MRSKFILTVAASLLAGTIAAGAQVSGAPSGEKDRSGQPTDSEGLSATPRPGTQAPQTPSGTVGSGPAKKAQPPMRDDTPLQPGGASPSAPPQAEGTDAQPRPK